MKNVTLHLPVDYYLPRKMCGRTLREGERTGGRSEQYDDRPRLQPQGRLPEGARLEVDSNQTLSTPGSESDSERSQTTPPGQHDGGGRGNVARVS